MSAFTDLVGHHHKPEPCGCPEPAPADAVVMRRLDVLADELGRPLVELLHLLSEPLAVFTPAGDVVFDTQVLGDLDPKQIVGDVPSRRSVTLVNASPGGGANLILGRERITSTVGTGLFTLIPQMTIKLSTRKALWVTASAPGAILSLAIEEVR